LKNQLERKIDQIRTYELRLKQNKQQLLETSSSLTVESNKVKDLEVKIKNLSMDSKITSGKDTRLKELDEALHLKNFAYQKLQAKYEKRKNKEAQKLEEKEREMKEKFKIQLEKCLKIQKQQIKQIILSEMQ